MRKSFCLPGGRARSSTPDSLDCLRPGSRILRPEQILVCSGKAPRGKRLFTIDVIRPGFMDRIYRSVQQRSAWRQPRRMWEVPLAARRYWRTESDGELPNIMTCRGITSKQAAPRITDSAFKQGQQATGEAVTVARAGACTLRIGRCGAVGQSAPCLVDDPQYIRPGELHGLLVHPHLRRQSNSPPKRSTSQTERLVTPPGRSPTPSRWTAREEIGVRTSSNAKSARFASGGKCSPLYVYRPI